MRPGQNSRRGRNRNNRRSNLPNRNQTFDSNGPDVRVRGTAHQVLEKYQALARDAASAGDPVMTESYLQHAEHYQRIINEVNEAYNKTQQEQERQRDDRRAQQGGEQAESRDERDDRDDDRDGGVDENQLPDFIASDGGDEGQARRRGRTRTPSGRRRQPRSQDGGEPVAALDGGDPRDQAGSDPLGSDTQSAAQGGDTPVADPLGGDPRSADPREDASISAVESGGEPAPKRPRRRRTRAESETPAEQAAD